MEETFFNVEEDVNFTLVEDHYIILNNEVIPNAWEQVASNYYQ